MAVAVVGICGSFRRGSFNAALLGEMQRRAPDGLTIETADISGLPFYNADLETDEARPAAVEELKSRVRAADGLLLVTPEYDYGVPGVVHNAIEWMSRPAGDPTLLGKPVAFAGASTGYMGTIRCQLQLRQSWYYFKAPVFSQVELTISGSRDAFDAQGRLTNEFFIGQVEHYLGALRDWLEGLRA